MEVTMVSIGRSVLSGALGFAKSTFAEEVALQLGVNRDKAFITDELEMMQSFMMTAHEEQDEHSRVVRTWVKQVRDTAYDVEDGLQDFFLRIHQKSWWRIPRTLLDRHHVATQMKELRAKVEDVSQRNLRYRLIGRGSQPVSASDLSITTYGALFGVDEARRHATNHFQSESWLDLTELILNNKKGLGSDQIGVIGLWGTSGTEGHTSIILGAYENPIIKHNFPCRAWIRVAHPFHRKEFVQSIVEQFRASTKEAVDFLLEPEGEKAHELAHEYCTYVNTKMCLVVLTNLLAIEEWHQIIICFPENKLGIQIIASTEQFEVASLCPGQESTVSKLKEMSAEQTIYAFYQKSFQDATYSSRPASSALLAYIPENEIQEDQSHINDHNMILQERLTRTKTVNTVSGLFDELRLIGRDQEKSDIIKLILEKATTQQFQVITVWGMVGLGKTTLIKHVYHSQEVSDIFEKRAFVTVLRPFKLEELLKSLVHQLHTEKYIQDFVGDTKRDIALMGVEELTRVMSRRSQGKKCFIVLDDLSCTAEWDKIMPSLLAMKNPSLIVVVTTSREDIAEYCCQKPEYMQRPEFSPYFLKKSKEKECVRLLSILQDKDAFDLFTTKVFKDKTIYLGTHYRELVETAKLILKNCNGLPLAIVTIGGFLAHQPTKTVAEWRKLNESIKMERNVKLSVMLMISYNNLPYYLKSCFLYMSIFPEDGNVRRRRLVCRWIAEGYSPNKSVAERYFMELIERSMILSTQQSVSSIQGFDSYQLHNLIRDIITAKSMEENLVFRLEEGCSLNSHGIVRHLAISSSWDGDVSELESVVELSRIRSLTVFDRWRPFYLSDKMRFLRVLDLEGTEGLADHHLEHIGKNLHLRYLSLRGCDGIFYLPDSVGNLRQLETLDIKYTRILMLPRTITKLSKLRDLQAGSVSLDPHEGAEQLCCVPGRMSFVRRRGACASFARSIERYNVGVKVPRGIRKMKTLHTLRYVHLAWGNSAVQEIKGLTELRSLGVFGINTKNGPEFCSAISSLYRLESLSVQSEGDLYDCLHVIMSSPLENLQSLKLCGRMTKVPEWIKGLQNLVKLRLELDNVELNSKTMQVLGNLPNLCILHLKVEFFQTERPIHFDFKCGPFRRLLVLRLIYVEAEIKSLEFDFEATSMPKLAVPGVRPSDSTPSISGLQFLPNIKEVCLSVFLLENITKEEAHTEAKSKEDKVKEDIRKQLAANQNGQRPILKML